MGLALWLQLVHQNSLFCIGIEMNNFLGPGDKSYERYDCNDEFGPEKDKDFFIFKKIVFHVHIKKHYYIELSVIKQHENLSSLEKANIWD